MYACIRQMLAVILFKHTIFYCLDSLSSQLVCAANMDTLVVKHCRQCTVGCGRLCCCCNSCEKVQVMLIQRIISWFCRNLHCGSF